ncbi:CFEM domain-containing protein [Apiospora kogelbergensis]|uniref:CFEM domain-containing protein n=1 Tax=Apiospora kogelbergensis TaxID=1337665 RepID=A0AAW0QVK5_9PEZI
MDLIPSSSCHTFTNSSCICSDSNLRVSIAQCVSTTCSGFDAFEFEKVAAQACDSPVRSRKVELWSFVLAELCTIVCSLLRITSRILLGNWDLDDYLFFPIFVIRILAFGVDVWTLDPETVTVALKLFFIDETLWQSSVSTSASSPHDRFRTLVYVTIGIVVVSALVFLALQIAQCIPVSLVWEGWKMADSHLQKCLNINILTIAAGYTSIAQDGIVLLLPLPILLSLETPPMQRLKICCLFSLGVLATAVSCIRMKYILQFQATTNPTWDHTDSLIWTGLEVNVAILILCMVPIRQLFSRLQITPVDNGSLKKPGYSPPGSSGSGWPSLKENLPQIRQTNPKRDIFLLFSRDDSLYEPSMPKETGKRESLQLEEGDGLENAPAEAEVHMKSPTAFSATSPVNWPLPAKSEIKSDRHSLSVYSDRHTSSIYSDRNFPVVKAPIRVAYPVPLSRNEALQVLSRRLPEQALRQQPIHTYQQDWV